MKADIQVINQVFELKQKIAAAGKSEDFERNFNRLFAVFEEEGFLIQDPTNEPYAATRTDCEASIAGQLSPKMKIVKTLKPVIYKRTADNMQLLQKAIVFVEKN